MRMQDNCPDKGRVFDLMHSSMFPDEFGAVFLAQVTAFALVQIWRYGRQASRQELGNRPRPAHDAIRLISTGLAVVCGLVLLIIFIAHPIANSAGSDGFIVPVVAFLIFIYVVLVVGIRSSHHTSRDKSNPWLAGLSMFAGATLLLAAMALPMFLLPHTQIPPRYQTRLALVVGVSVVVTWHFVAHWLQQRSQSVS
jgi:hypothetical protein